MRGLPHESNDPKMGIEKVLKQNIPEVTSVESA